MRSLERDATTLLARLDERVRTLERNRSRLTTDVVDGTFSEPGPPGPPGDPGSPGSPGSPGTPGAPGSVWREGSGAPSNALGIDGDFYLDGDTGDVYEKAAGAYSVIANIEGPAGPTGPAGPAVPTHMVDGETFTVPDRQGITYAWDIVMDGTASIVMGAESQLVDVR